MKVVSSYESRVIEYDNSHEMNKDMRDMEANGWRATSVSYGKLRVRYRRDK